MLADQRHRAGLELSSDALEMWHRDTLPLFLDRTRSRLAEGCATSHGPWPAAGRHRTYHDAADNRQRAYHDDTTTQEDPHLVDQQATARLALVDLGTGQLINATPSDGPGTPGCTHRVTGGSSCGRRRTTTRARWSPSG